AALLCWAGVARAERRLSLSQAVDLAIAADPLVTESHVQEDRANLGVLRAQLDRFSLKIDAQLTELWAKQNILGPSVPPYCAIPYAGDQAACDVAAKAFGLGSGALWNPN